MEMLAARWAEGKFVCVGLDSEIVRLPNVRKVTAGSSRTYPNNPWFKQVSFNRAIVDATADLVCAFKPNVAFYKALGADGLRALRLTCIETKERYPDVPIILDAKYADIGNSNAGYVEFAFDHCGADAVTVHPYLGAEAMKPFLDRADKGVIVLCRTSNPGAGEFQDLEVTVKEDDFNDLYANQLLSDAGERYVIPRRLPLYQYVAHRVHSQVWNYNGNCAVVVGATYPGELAQVRAIVGDMPILIPGIGAQGGDLEATVKAGVNSQGAGMIINSSRGIIFASSGEDFDEAARRETKKLNGQIRHELALAA